MKLIGFRLTKINSERVSDSLENLKLNTNIDILDIKESKIPSFKSDGSLIEVTFNYLLSYEPKTAHIELKGILILELDSENTKKILNSWDQKDFPKELKIPLFNLILRKTHLKVLELEEDLGLPPHVPFPSLKEQSLKSN